jgi:hypothetical protein
MKIVESCNELIQLKIQGVKKRAEYDTESRKTTQEHDEIQRKFRQQCRPKKTPANDGIYRESVTESFQDDDVQLSPFLRSHLAKLCYHIHLLTTSEVFVDRIRQDNMIIINWLHVAWEKMEKEQMEMKDEINKLKGTIQAMEESQKQKEAEKEEIANHQQPENGI